MEQIVRELRGAGEDGRKVTILGTAQDETITLTALTLARLLAREAKVVVLGLSTSSTAMAVASSDPDAPGLADLMLGDASFAQVITRDRMSQVHLISAGRAGTDRATLQSPRIALAIDALLKVYDHVLLDAGKASDLPSDLLATNARAIVVPDASMTKEARRLMYGQLKAVGFAAVTMLNNAGATRRCCSARGRGGLTRPPRGTAFERGLVLKGVSDDLRHMHKRGVLLHHALAMRDRRHAESSKFAAERERDEAVEYRFIALCKTAVCSRPIRFRDRTTYIQARHSNR